MKILILLVSAVLVSCASLEAPKSYATNYRKNISAGRCEDALAQIPLEKDDTQFMRVYRGSIGYLAYVSTLPITLGLDFITMQRCGQGGLGCSSESREKRDVEILFPASSYTYEHTKDMRCPDTRYYLQKFLEVSECFEGRSDRESLLQALSQLEYLEDQFDSVVTCIGMQDSHVVRASMERVKKKLLNLRRENSQYQLLSF